MREEIEPVVLEPKKEQFKASEPRDPQIYGPRPPLENHARLLLRQLQQAHLKRLMNNYDKALGVECANKAAYTQKTEEQKP